MRPRIDPVMAPLEALILGFVVGGGVGYGIRALMSSRRRAQAQRRFIETGTHGGLGK